jgi:hypothetical protein
MSAGSMDTNCLTIAPAGWVQVSRQEWDELHAELRSLRSQLGGSHQIGEIIRAAAAIGGVRVQDIVGRCRSLTLMRIRLAVFVLARGMEIDSKEIIVALGRKRTLDLHYERAATKYVSTDSRLVQLISRLEAACS